MIIEWAWERLSAYKPLIISIKNKMVCQGHPAMPGEHFTLDIASFFDYSGILPGYMITSSPLTNPQFRIGMVHFFVISFVEI